MQDSYMPAQHIRMMITADSRKEAGNGLPVPASLYGVTVLKKRYINKMK